MVLQTEVLQQQNTIQLCDEAFFATRINNPVNTMFQDGVRKTLEQTHNLLYPMQSNLGDHIIHHSVHAEFSQILEGKGVQTRVRQTQTRQRTPIEQAQKILYPEGAGVSFLSRMPIQTVLLRELSVATGVDTSLHNSNHPPYLLPIREENLQIDPVDIHNKGEMLLSCIEKPIFFIYQAGSSATKRFTDKQIIYLSRYIKAKRPYSHIIIATDGQYFPQSHQVRQEQVEQIADTFLQSPDANTVGAYAYAASCILGTDTGWAWLSAAAMASNPRNESKFNSHQAFFLYTVANPEVWGIPGSTNIPSFAIQHAIENNPRTILQGLFVQSAYTPSFYTSFYGDRETPGYDTPIHQRDFSHFLSKIQSLI